MRAPITTSSRPSTAKATLPSPQTIAENYITQGVVGIFGGNEGSTTGIGNAIKASGDTGVIGVGFDKSDAIQSLIRDGLPAVHHGAEPRRDGL